MVITLRWWNCCQKIRWAYTGNFKSKRTTLLRLRKSLLIETSMVEDCCSARIEKTICPSLSNAIKAQDTRQVRQSSHFYMINASYNESLPVRFLRLIQYCLAIPLLIFVPFNCMRHQMLCCEPKTASLESLQILHLTVIMEDGRQQQYIICTSVTSSLRKVNLARVLFPFNAYSYRKLCVHLQSWGLWSIAL